jgi:PIN domain nuclease of toxin-antitoxin system
MSDARLSDSARRVIEDGGTERFVSAISPWEIAIKTRAGKLEAGPIYKHELPEALVRFGFKELALSWLHGDLAGRLPGAHKDPFDRMLAAQSLAEDMPIITSDAAFRQFGVKTIW